MNTLANYLDTKELIELLERNPNLETVEDEELEKLFSYLKSLGCDEYTIKESFYQNPYYLEKTAGEIEELVTVLSKFGITDYDELFYRNPFILSRRVRDVSAYFNNQMSRGVPTEDIIEELLTGIQI